MEQKGILHEIWQSFKPSLYELVAYLVILAALIGIAVYRVAVDGSIGSDSSDVISSIQQTKGTFFAFINQNEGLGRVFLFGFWFLVGTITYIISWSFISSFINFSRNIDVSNRYVHPKLFHQSNYWVAIIGRSLVRVSAGIALLFFCIFVITILVPNWLVSIQSLFSEGWNMGYVSNFIFTIIMIAVCLHIATILFRYALMRHRYRYEG